MIQRFRQFVADEDGMAMTEFVATLPVIIIIFVGIVKLHEEIIETFSDMGGQYAGTWKKATAMDSQRSGASRPSVGTSAEPYSMPDGSVEDAFDRASLRTGAGVVEGEVYRDRHYQVYAHPNEIDFDTTANHIQGETIDAFKRPLRFKGGFSGPLVENHGRASIRAYRRWLDEDRMPCFDDVFATCQSEALSVDHACHSDPSGCCEDLAGSACQTPDDWPGRVAAEGFAGAGAFGSNTAFVNEAQYGSGAMLRCFDEMGQSMETAGSFEGMEACIEASMCTNRFSPGCGF